MNLSRFTNPANDPCDLDREEQIEDERADAWNRQVVDREQEKVESLSKTQQWKGNL